MNLKLFLLFIFFTAYSYTNAQVSIFKAPNTNLSAARIMASTQTPGDLHILYSAVNSQGLLIYRNGAFVGNSGLNLRSNAQELPLGLLEIRPGEFLMHGASWDRTGNLTPAISRMRTDRVAWAKGFNICDDFANLGLFSGIALKDSSIYVTGASRNTSCGRNDTDLSAVKLDMQGNIQSQVSFIPADGPSTEIMFSLQPHQNRFYFTGFSTIAPCGGANVQKPGIGWFDANLDNRRWWTYTGANFELNAAIYHLYPLPSNPNRLVCNVRFSLNSCTDEPAGAGLFVIDSLANPVSAFRFQTGNPNDRLFCRYSQLIPSDESIVMLGHLTSSSGNREVLIRVSPSGRILFVKAISAAKPGQNILLEDLVVSGQNITIVGKIQDKGEDHMLLLQTDLNGNFSDASGCLLATNLNFSTQPINIVKTEAVLSQTQDMKVFNINYRVSKEPISNESCAVCQSGDFPILADVDSTCFNTCHGRISLQGVDSTLYTYRWSNGRSSANIGGLCASTYQVTITKNGICSKDTTVEVKTTQAIQLMPELVNTCADSCLGSIQLNAMGGEGALNYRWDSGFTTNSIGTLCAGRYGVSVTDARNCIIVDTFDISSNSLDIGLLIQNLNCSPPARGQLLVDILEGTMPFSISIDGGPYGAIRDFELVYGRKYHIAVRDANLCTDTASIAIPPVTQIELQLPVLQPVKFGDSVHIAPILPNNGRELAYTWSTKKPENLLNCRDCPQSTVTGLVNDSIFLSVKDTIGCMANAFTLLKVIDVTEVFIPNAFSPNGDDKNETFTVYGQRGAATVRNMKIFGRWGELVYESSNFPLNDLQSAWDGNFRGKPALQGVYVYVIDVQFRSGRSELFKGNIHLIR